MIEIGILYMLILDLLLILKEQPMTSCIENAYKCKVLRILCFASLLLRQEDS